VRIRHSPNSSRRIKEMPETFEEEIKKYATKFWKDLNHDELRPCYEENYAESEDVDLWVRVEDAVAVHRLHYKKLLDFVNKNRPRTRYGAGMEYFDIDEVEQFFEGLLKKGDKKK